MSRSVSFKDILRMLEGCANGFTLRMATHSRVVTFNNKFYRNLPKYDQIFIGEVRKIIRHLEIDRNCAEKYVAI